jgi:hypothetical protein
MASQNADTAAASELTTSCPTRAVLNMLSDSRIGQRPDSSQTLADIWSVILVTVT